MNSCEDNKAKDVTLVEETGGTSHQGLKEKINQLMKLKESGDKSQSLTFSKDEKARLERQYKQHIEDYKFYLDFGLKVIGFYYAIVGGIPSLISTEIFTGTR